ncbi:hypothetical protein JW905_17810, partial [bacterium]|nr:hypothetical protein [candidate division CSSED10-310 bacterium]
MKALNASRWWRCGRLSTCFLLGCIAFAVGAAAMDSQYRYQWRPAELFEMTESGPCRLSSAVVEMGVDPV